MGSKSEHTRTKTGTHLLEERKPQDHFLRLHVSHGIPLALSHSSFPRLLHNALVVLGQSLAADAAELAPVLQGAAEVEAGEGADHL